MFEKNELLNLKEKIEKMLYQLDNHQQAKAPIMELESVISSLKDKNELKTKQEISSLLEGLMSAICDSSGLGRLNLMLKNARIPPKYYDIFYSMLGFKARGGVPLCVDCGAHAGLISDIILFCGGVSYLFEPNLHLNFFLEKKFANNPQAKLYQKAVAASNYKTKFKIFGGRMLSQGNRICESAQESSDSYEVEVIDLCEFLEKELLSKNERIYFLKLDVEGVEFEIMQKLIEKELYKKIDYIACETHEYMFDEGSKKLENLKSQIKKHKIDNIFLDWV